MYKARKSDGRLPFLSQLDLYLQHELRLPHHLRLSMSINAINLLNQDTATNYYPNELFEGQAIAIDEDAFFAGFDTQALIADARFFRPGNHTNTAVLAAPTSDSRTSQRPSWRAPGEHPFKPWLS